MRRPPIRRSTDPPGQAGPVLQRHRPRQPAKDADAENRQIADQVLQAQQSSLLEAPLTPLEKPEFAFVYRYTSDGHRHEHMIHDWEVQESHRQYKRRYGEGALDHLKRMYGETIPADNLHFIMGTMAAHPRTRAPSSSSASCAQ